MGQKGWDGSGMRDTPWLICLLFTGGDPFAHEPVGKGQLWKERPHRSSSNGQGSSIEPKKSKGLFLGELEALWYPTCWMFATEVCTIVSEKGIFFRSKDRELPKYVHERIYLVNKRNQIKPAERKQTRKCKIYHNDILGIPIWLVVEPPLRKKKEFVSWDDEIIPP